MPRKSKRSRKTKDRSGVKIGFIALIFLFVCLASIWKSNAVKDLYGDMKTLEKTRDELIKSNTHLKVQLTEAKSLDNINKAASKLGLTHNVSDRLYIVDPVDGGSDINPQQFVSSGERIINNIEEIVLRSGTAYGQGNGKKGK